MINIIDKRKCLENNCNKRPTYNFTNKKFAIYCSEHKKENMIDINHKKCIESKCKLLPSFNFINQKNALYCTLHKKEHMINVINKACLEENCNKIPIFNYENKSTGIYCTNHKKENMIDVKNKKCKNCNDTHQNKKYNGYCCRCFINLFPNEKISRNYKVKENHMTDFIKQEFNHEVLIFDKQTGGCSRKRPDCYIDKFTHIVIIECDENQHKNTSCENKRTMELFQDFNCRPIVFIRFNPDKYINEDNEKIPSSFKMHKALDVPIIRNKQEWESRLNLLKNTINKLLNVIPKKEITYDYLFYDNF